MSELVFNIGNVFSSDGREGVLGKEEAKYFYIAPYQRGYKWASDAPSDPVCLLMSDIKDSFEGKEQEYYLQYITVKKNIQNEYAVLEVIDGQQRLTTLSLLFSVLAYKLKSDDLNFTKNKLKYGIRANVWVFFLKYIYKNIDEIIGKDWDDFVEKNQMFDEQDIYYLFSAVNKIYELLPQDDLQGFYDFVRDKVQIILNKVESKVSSERIFSNLNTNKVDLTNAELVKGLILTKKAREKDDILEVRHFKEIMELRSAMGRQWDDISRWVNNDAIFSFFFSPAHDGMEKFLLLVALKEGYVPSAKSSSKYDLFNFYQSRIKKGVKKSGNYFVSIKLLFSILKDWYEDTQIYNYLGYVFFARKSEITSSDIVPFINYNREDLLKVLNDRVNSLIPSEISTLEYKANNDEIHRVLLALSVFLSEKRFDFYSFQNPPKGKWSLEHIFPQNPDDLPNEIGKKDIELIIRLIGDKKITDYSSYLKFDEKIDEIKTLHKEIKAKLKKTSCTFNYREKEFLYDIMKTDKLNCIGNMALLLSTDNSSNSNGMFDYKRYNIVNRVSDGSFVPKHTYDVFSKLISDKMIPDLTAWTEKDIDVHNDWVTSKITQITSKKHTAYEI